MRTGSSAAAIQSLETQSVASPAFRVLSYDLLWRFSQSTTGATDLSSNVPMSAIVASGGSTGRVSGYSAIGLYVATLDAASVANCGPYTSNTSRVQVSGPECLRGSFDGSSNFYFTSAAFGAQPVVRRRDTGGTTTNVSPAIPVTLINTATMMRRVDAVCWTVNGTIVRIGHYNFDQDIFTAEFWLCTASSVTRLNTIIQGDLPDSPSAFVALHGSYTSANSNGQTICVVSTDGKRPLSFTVTNGIESDIAPAIPVDAVPNGHEFLPTCLTKIGNLFYMGIKQGRPMGDGTGVYMACYLTSADLQCWSIGEYSSYITASSLPFVIPDYPVAPSSVVYALSNGSAWSAPARNVDNPTISKTDISAHILEMSGSHAANSADSLILITKSSAAITALYPGAGLTIETGYNNSTGGPERLQVAEYIVVASPRTVTAAGVIASEVQCVDQASWRLINWSSSTDIDRWSRLDHEDPLTDMSQMAIKTPKRDVEVTSADKLVSVGLNDPFVAYTPGRDARDGIARAIIRFGSADANSLSSFGFVFGAGDKGFNAMMVPKNNTWTGYVQTQVAAVSSNLRANTPWATPRRMQGLWESVLTDQFAKIVKHPNAAFSGQDVYFRNSFTFSANTDYEVVMRKHGRRLQVFARAINRTNAGFVGASQMTLVAEYRWNEHSKIGYEVNSYWGFACGTDVFVSADAFAGSEYGDIEQSLSTSQNMTNFSRLVATGGVSGANSLTNVAAQPGFNLSSLTVGMYVYVAPQGFAAVAHKITSITIGTPTNIVLSGNFVAGPPNGTSCQIFLQANGQVFGQATSGVSDYSDTMGKPFLNDPGATKRNRRVGGYGAFISNDNTACSLRYVETDGVVHTLRSGSVFNGGTYLGWDLTNPMRTSEGSIGLPFGSTAANSGSDPLKWRFVMHQGRLFAASAATYGLPTGTADRRYMIVNDEIVRYRDMTFKRTDGVTDETWCSIPAYYTPLAATASNSTVLTHWNSGGNQPGTIFSTIPDVSGLLVEISSRNTDNLEESRQYYAASATAGPPSTLTLTESYPNSITDLECIAIVSGRGQFATAKTQHSATDPVCYYPITPGATAKITNLVQVKQFAAHRGLYSSVEDDLKYVASLTGVRDIRFRNRGTFSGTLGTAQTTLSASESDFVLDMASHIFAGTDNRLRVLFRSKYTLDIQGALSAGQITAGRLGNVRLRLAVDATSPITAGGDGMKWIADVEVPLSDVCPFGSVSGSFTENAALLQATRVVLRQNLLSIEINGQQIWVFDLSIYNTDSGHSHYYQQYGPVALQYTLSGSAMNAKLQEMPSQVENHVIDMGASGTESLSFVLDGRHIYSRTTQTGGIEFAQFSTRDNAGTVSTNLLQDSRSNSALDIAGHVLTTGAEFGEGIDDAWIRQNGYRFGTSQNHLLDTVSDSSRESTLIIRLAKEMSRQAQLSLSRVRPILQPEDYVSVSYTSSGDGPASAAEEFVITSVEWSIRREAMSSLLNLRKRYL
jgi:hypothetical protein